MFITEKGIYLMIVLEILPRSIMWAISTDITRIIHIQTLTTLDRDNTQTFHGIVKINMLQHLVDKIGLLNRRDFAKKIKGKETPTTINLVLLKF